ncbi:hypothetical protein AB0M29_39175 [Streptomyces sp. NPDC051976]|uniref:hypothetical protein n=1 Tax=Streptomyces sp. NPDC051976 TaxID=3154947 RepID=UPI00342BC10A
MAIRTTRRTRLAGTAVAVATGPVCAPSVQTAAAGEPAARHCLVDTQSRQQRCFGTFTEVIDRAR